MTDGRRSQPKARRLRPRYVAAAGALLFAAGIVAFLGIITAEALYPEGYSTAQNAISDLGATEPPDSVVEQPSATIFNTVMIVCGALVLVASACVQIGFRRTLSAIFIAFFGLGALGVGVFPGDQGTIHAIFALLTFIAGGLAAIFSYPLSTSPFRYFSLVLGAVALAVLVTYSIMGDSSALAELGIGGVERWIAYPILMWVAGFGGHLMGRAR
jgi:hypothetical membrane protein